MTRYPASVLGAVLIAGLLSVGCSDDEGDSAGPSEAVTSTSSTQANPDGPTFAGLCEAIEAATTGDLGKVETVFDHGPLHELASAAEADDRGVSARLLEAKEQVESDLSDDATPAANVATDLRTLADATRTAQDLVGDPVLPNCQSEEP